MREVSHTERESVTLSLRVTQSESREWKKKGREADDQLTNWKSYLRRQAGQDNELLCPLFRLHRPSRLNDAAVSERDRVRASGSRNPSCANGHNSSKSQTFGLCLQPSPRSSFFPGTEQRMHCRVTPKGVVVWSSFWPFRIPNRMAPFSARRPDSVRRPEVRPEDVETLRAQWKYAVRTYAKAYSNAWGAALMVAAGAFAVGWMIKGENPLKVSSAGQVKKN